MNISMIISLIISVLGVGLAYFLTRRGLGPNSTYALDMIKGFALDLIYRAEKEFGGGTGQFKKASVIETILNSAFYSTLPGGVKKLINFETLSGIIDEICDLVFNKQINTNDSVKKLLGKDGV